MQIRKHPFTLVELLVVISIIGILAGLALPAVSSAYKSAVITRAKESMTALKTATMAMITAYGRCTKSSKEELKDSDYETLIEELSLMTSTGATYSPAINKRRITYLDMGKNTEFKDPWGNNFVVFWDHDADGQVQVTEKDQEITLAGQVFVSSAGPDGVWETTDDLFSWEK